MHSPRSSSPKKSHLVRRVADDHVELHIASKQLGHPSLDVVGVDERVGVGFKPLAPVQRVFWLAPQYVHLPSAHVCSMRSNQMLPASLAKPLAMECLPLACFEQYTLRRASRLVRYVMPMPNTCFVRM